jgi:hypothetical protein
VTTKEQASGQSNAQVERSFSGTLYEYSEDRMRLCLVLLWMTAWVDAQTRPVFQAPPAQTQRPGPRHGRGFGAPWWAWPGWWSGSQERQPLKPPVDPPPERPLLIRNPDYEPARMNPIVREVPEGLLPARQPDAGATAAGAGSSKPCRLREANGREFDAAECQVSDDMVRWRSGSGRWFRATLDLVAPLER